MDYETFGSNPNRANRMDSDTSNTSSVSSSSREVNVLPSAVRIIDTPFGKIRVPSDLEKMEIAFLFLASVSILAVIAMAIYRLADPIDDSDTTFALVLLVNSVFCLVYIFHGVFGERPYELWVFMIATVVVVLYCVIGYAVTSHKGTLKLVRMIVVLVFAPFDLFLCFKISMQHYSSKNLIIRTLHSAKIKFQNACMNMFIFQALLKLDTQLGISLVVLVLTSGVEDADSGEIVILVVGLFLEIVWLIVGSLVPKYEDMTWLYAFIGLSLPQPAYVLYKIIKTGQDWNEQSKIINASIIACACLFLVTRCLVSYYLWIVVNNFNKGLRQAVYFPDEQQNTGKEEEQETQSPTPNEPDNDYLGENVHYDVHD